MAAFIKIVGRAANSDKTVGRCALARKRRQTPNNPAPQHASAPSATSSHQPHARGCRAASKTAQASTPPATRGSERTPAPQQYHKIRGGSTASACSPGVVVSVHKITSPRRAPPRPGRRAVARRECGAQDRARAGRAQARPSVISSGRSRGMGQAPRRRRAPRRSRCGRTREPASTLFAEDDHTVSSSDSLSMSAWCHCRRRPAAWPTDPSSPSSARGRPRLVLLRQRGHCFDGAAVPQQLPQACA